MHNYNLQSPQHPRSIDNEPEDQEKISLSKFHHHDNIAS